MTIWVRFDLLTTVASVFGTGEGYGNVLNEGIQDFVRTRKQKTDQ